MPRMRILTSAEQAEFDTDLDEKHLLSLADLGRELADGPLVKACRFYGKAERCC